VLLFVLCSGLTSIQGDEEHGDAPLNDDMASCDRKTCRVCGKRFMSYAHMMRHYRVHTGEKYKCRYCDREFTQKNNVKRHIKKMHSDIALPATSSRRTRCTQSCSEDLSGDYINQSSVFGSMFSDEKTYRHKESGRTSVSDDFRDESGLQPYSGELDCRVNDKERNGELRNEPTDCFACGKRFSCMNSLKLHLCDHSCESHKCILCGSTFAELKNFKLHMKIKHNCSPKWTATEDNGKRNYANNGLLNSKLELGDDFEYSSSCKKFDIEPQLHYQDNEQDEEVGQTSLTDADNSPASVHIKPLKCFLCGKRFSRSDYLRWHLRTHAGEEYKCDYCDKSFADPYGARRHMRMHTGDSQYQCDVCPRAFTRSDHLKEHARKHSVDYSAPFPSSRYEDVASTNRTASERENSMGPWCQLNSSTTWHTPDVDALDLRNSGRSAIDSQILEQTSSDLEVQEQCALDLRRSETTALELCSSNGGSVHMGGIEQKSLYLNGYERPVTLNFHDSQLTVLDLCSSKPSEIDWRSSMQPNFICGKLDIVIKKGGSLSGDQGQEGVGRSLVQRTDCHICGKRFMRRGNMQRHMRTHAGQKHRCPVCYSMFTRSDNMKKHMISQHSSAVEPGLNNGTNWSVGVSNVTDLDEQWSSSSEEDWKTPLSETVDRDGKDIVVVGRNNSFGVHAKSVNQQMDRDVGVENDSWLTVSGDYMCQIVSNVLLHRYSV